MEGKFMYHTDYSSWIILNEVRIADKHNKSLISAFRKAASKLNCRISQVSGRYYYLKDMGTTIDQVAGWTEEDKRNTDTGSPTPLVRNHSDKRKAFLNKEGIERRTYDRNQEEKVQQPVRKTVSFTAIKNKDSSENIYFNKLNKAVTDLIKDTPKEFRIDVVKSIMKDL